MSLEDEGTGLVTVMNWHCTLCDDRLRKERQYVSVPEDKGTLSHYRNALTLCFVWRQMQVIATDDGINPRSATTSVTITVVRHPGAPILSPDPCQTSISENVGVGYVLLTLRVSDSNTAVSWSLKVFRLFSCVVFCCFQSLWKIQRRPSVWPPRWPCGEGVRLISGRSWVRSLAESYLRL